MRSGKKRVLTRRHASGEGVSHERGGAAADGIVVHDHAARAEPARAGARVYAVHVDARVHLRALGRDHTLGSAAGRRAQVPRQARAHGLAAMGAAHAIGPARGRVARVSLHRS